MTLTDMQQPGSALAFRRLRIPTPMCKGCCSMAQIEVCSSSHWQLQRETALWARRRWCHDALQC